MANVDKYEAGAFCWAELATSDDQGAEKFYTKLFGWTAQGNPMGEMGTYYMMQLGGRPVCAMFKLGPQMKGVPPHWMTYISVDDVDATVKKAESLGAKVMNPPMDVYDFGRMAVISDPTGAAFSLWQPKQHTGAGVRGGNGTTCWNELITTDVNAAKKFYAALFGWSFKESPEYNEITNGNAPNPQGGIMQMRPAQLNGSGPKGPERLMPSAWSVYFQVDSIDGAVDKAQTLSANLLMGPMEIGHAGRFAVLKDPQGAVFQFYEGQH